MRSGQYEASASVSFGRRIRRPSRAALVLCRCFGKGVDDAMARLAEGADGDRP
jgi:hypothetical protein